MFVVKIAMRAESVGTAEYAVPTELLLLQTCRSYGARSFCYNLEVKKSEKFKNTRNRIN
ncbi:hypothetical protein BH18ACI3_BH18ACI3_07510 [soil metagenome]